MCARQPPVGWGPPSTLKAFSPNRLDSFLTHTFLSPRPAASPGSRFRGVVLYSLNGARKDRMVSAITGGSVERSAPARGAFGQEFRCILRDMLTPGVTSSEKFG